MKKINIFLLNMEKEGQINGVTRCIQVIANVLSCDPLFKITWVRFVHGIKHQGTSIDNTTGLQRVEIPLPSDFSAFLVDYSVREIYWKDCIVRLATFLNQSENTIIHIHTMNLIELAVMMKDTYNIRIITHIHCIPWKNLCNTNQQLFRTLYKEYISEDSPISFNKFVCSKHEGMCYTHSDRIICVTKNAKNFICQIVPNCLGKIDVIYNGIPDLYIPREKVSKSHMHRCLFVGNGQYSKGIIFVLQALKAVTLRHDCNLTIAGFYTKHQQEFIKRRFPSLSISFMGVVTLTELKDLYMKCDLGIIASLQEQCSYVALEMMMFGLPIVVTSVDGLCEVFPGTKNCMKIRVVFDPSKGLRPDISQMITSLKFLIENPSQSQKIGQNARQRYLRLYSEHIMIQKIRHLYSTLYNE